MGRMSDWKSVYREKIVPIEQAVGMIKSGDVIATGFATGLPVALLDALAARVDELENVKIYTSGGTNPSVIAKASTKGRLMLNSSFFMKAEREGRQGKSAVSYQPVHFSEMLQDRLFRQKINVVLAAGTPPDEQGRISTGTSALEPELLERADLVVIQINENVPFVSGSCLIPAEKVSALVLQDEPLTIIDKEEMREEERKIGEYIVERIPDGACIQLGIGSVGTAVGSLLTCKKHLGIHTEMFTESMMDMIRSGAVDNSRKGCCRGISVYGFAAGTQELYDFLRENGEAETRPFSWVNDPRVISLNDNMISVNSAMQIDLSGQACAESIGLRQYSGTGGQGDYVRGAKWSKGGMSFLALPSTRTDREGKLYSKITLTLPLGSVVTTPRTDLQFVVTEYGLADLRGATLDERAEKLIAIAHPAFRDELRWEAKKAGVII